MPSLNPLDAVTSALKSANIIPDVIPTSLNFTPTTLLSISFPSTNAEVLLGNELTKAETADEPLIYFAGLGDETANAFGGAGSEEEQTYTLAFLDPDAPSRADPKFGPFRHWVITGLKTPTAGDIQNLASQAQAQSTGTNLPPSAKTTKEATTPYRPPGPGPGSGVHRYTFLLFREPSGGYTIPDSDPEHGAQLEQRRSWSAVDFANRHGLVLVGANYFVLKAADA